MQPPAQRNFVPERKDDQRERPSFYHAQPRFTPASVTQYKSKVEVLPFFAHIPQQLPGNMMLPLREVNDFRKSWNQRRNGTFYNKSTVAAKPPDGRRPGLGYDHKMRSNNGNYMDYWLYGKVKQRGLLVKNY